MFGWVCTMALNAKSGKCDSECHTETKARTSNWPDRKNEWPIYMGAVLTQTKHKLIGKWPIDMGATPTQTDKTMTDRYRCGPDSNWTDRKMADRYRCCPDSNWHDEWPIDIGAVPTRTELTGRWPIDIGAAPTRTELIGRWPIDIGAAPTQTVMTRWWMTWSSDPKPKDDPDNDASKLGRGYAPVWQLIRIDN